MIGDYKKRFIDNSQKAKATRLSFGEELLALGGKDNRVVALDADLSKSTQTQFFAKEYPDRFFQMGIAEANMIGVAGGLARSGKIPFAASFAAFLTGRFDQIRMSVSFSGNPVKLVGTHAGVGIGEDGHSQMGLEDLGMMRGLPEMDVFQPSDDQDTREFMNWTLASDRAAYIRCTRQGCPVIKRPDNYKFAEGKWLEINEGEKLVLLSSGGALLPTIEAATILEKELQHEVGVVDAAWIKPLDASFLEKSIKKGTKLFVTVEDHYTVTGLGGAVAEALTELNQIVPLLRLGIKEFGQSASPADNYKHYGLTGEAIAVNVLDRLRAL